METGLLGGGGVQWHCRQQPARAIESAIEFDHLDFCSLADWWAPTKAASVAARAVGAI